MDKFENEIPKHIKKKGSSTSKSKEKSNHKHEYIECLLVEDGRPFLGTYCKFCGKIGNWQFGEYVHTERGYTIVHGDEVFERHPDLKRIVVDNIWQKYVTIDD